MTAVEFKSEISKYIAKSRLDKALAFFLENLKPEAHCYNEILVLSASFEQWKQINSIGTESSEDLQKHRNRTALAIADFADSLDNDDLKSQEISNKILVLCANDSDELHMYKFFGRMQFSSYKIVQTKSYFDPSKFEFIVFDNHSSSEKKFLTTHTVQNLPDAEKAHLNRLNDYLEKSDKFIVYYSHHFYDLVNEHRDRIHAANSQFALFSRIREMQEFVKNDRLYAMD